MARAVESEHRVGGVQAVSSCFGGGGFFAIAFSMGIADGLGDAGLPVREGPMLGTSGGSWAAGALASSVALADIVEVTARGKAAGMAQSEMTRKVFGDRRDPLVRTVAIERRTGRRRVLRGDQVGIADAVGASSAAPGMFPPYRIGGRRYVDGGMYSPTNAHLAAPARLLVLMVPMAGALIPAVGSGYAQLARNEARVWRLRARGRVLFVEPTPAVAAAAGPGLRRLFDPDTTATVYHHALRFGREQGERLARRRPAVGEPLAALAR